MITQHLTVTVVYYIPDRFRPNILIEQDDGIIDSTYDRYNA